MRPRTLRTAFLAAAVVASLVFPARVEAGGAVIPPEGSSDPTTLDVRVAISTSSSGTTRWNEVTVPSYRRLLWLVPARPGATIAWASNAWLPALEEATAPRIVRPSYSSPCNVATSPERSMPWSVTGYKQTPAAWTVHQTADGVRAAASSAGFAIQPELDDRITSLYASGWNLVAVEISSSTGTTTTGTLRISDDGGAALPLELVGSRTTRTRVTAFAIGTGVMRTPGTVDIDEAALHWGPSGSDFASWRRDLVQGGRGDVWLRESASHAALFDGVPASGGAPTPSVVAQYLGGTACATTAKNAGTSSAVVGTSLSSSTFACGSLDDLAIALDGLTPSSTVVTRWTGVITAGALGVSPPIVFDSNATQTMPVVRAGSYEACSAPSGSSRAPIGPGPTGGTNDEEIVDEGPDVVYVGDGCGGGTTTTTTYEEEEETTTTTSEDGCGGDTSTTSTSSDDGWDTDDDSSGDSCSSDTTDSSSSSSSSDSCSGSSTDSGGSDDGWDTEDSMSPKSKKMSLKTQPKRTKSPVSRYALFAFALILPLRRRARAALERR